MKKIKIYLYFSTNVPHFAKNDQLVLDQEAKMNQGAIVALDAFGCFVFLAAVQNTIVILIPRYVYVISLKSPSIGIIFSIDYYLLVINFL